MLSSKLPASAVHLAKNTKYYQKDRLCTVYDPQRNSKMTMPPRAMSKSYEQAEIHNNQILNVDIDKIKKEIIKSFDFHKIPYKS